MTEAQGAFRPAVLRRVAIVTGCASERGIGWATVARLASERWRVAMLDLADGPLAAARARVIDRGADPTSLETIACDVTSAEQVERAVAAVMGRFGRIDALVNNAGITAPTRIADIAQGEWDRIFAVNCTGVFLMTKAVIPAMRAQGYGRIVNLSSVSGKRGGGLFGGAHYSASKAAVLGFTKAVAREVAGDGITSNAVAPGMIDTGITGGKLAAERRDALTRDIPVGRFGQADDVADAIAYLCSEGAGYVTGEEIDINGGLHMD